MYNNRTILWLEDMIDFSHLQDVQYADIDHMDQNKDFTIDEVNFPGLPDYVRELKNERGMKFIIILVKNRT